MGNAGGNETDASKFESYRQELARLLELVDAENLDAIHQDVLATGVRLARAGRTTLEEHVGRLGLTHPEVVALGNRILKELANACRHTSPHGQ